MQEKLASVLKLNATKEKAGEKIAGRIPGNAILAPLTKRYIFQR
jgi:hypothetical protein